MTIVLAGSHLGFAGDCCSAQEDCLPCSSDESSCGNFVVSADYLYWQAHEEGLDYALDGIGDHSGGVVSTDKGSLKNLDWDAKSGFRVGAGFIFASNCWDVMLNYTWWKGDASDYVTGPTNAADATLWGTFTAPRGGEVFFYGTADWELEFHAANLEIGRTVCLGKDFNTRLFGGLTGVWTKDRYNILYDDRPEINFFHLVEHKQDFGGVGPRIGFESNWRIFKGLSFFADSAFSLIWGDYDIERKDDINNVIAVDTGDNFSTLRSLLNFKIGLRWDQCFCDSLHFFSKIAFEDMIFLQHNQFIKFASGDNSDGATVSKGVFNKLNTDLSLYGLTVSIGLSF